ncbi:MAG: CoA-binding protein [Gammaproteobacteria bacterium]|nr:CoA-binding protein [Gammaproteobacteria bacterium]
MSEFSNPSTEQIITLLQQCQRIAVVGLSPKSNRPSHAVARAMQSFGYTIVPVRPAVDSVLGEPAYPDLYAVPGKIDLVDVFRAPEHVDPIVDACIDLHVPALWLQDGVINVAAAQRAQEHGIMVVMDRCIYRDYKQFMPA